MIHITVHHGTRQFDGLRAERAARAERDRVAARQHRRVCRNAHVHLTRHLIRFALLGRAQPVGLRVRFAGRNRGLVLHNQRHICGELPQRRRGFQRSPVHDCRSNLHLACWRECKAIGGGFHPDPGAQRDGFVDSSQRMVDFGHHGARLQQRWNRLLRM